MSAGGVILFCLIFGILLVAWALMGMCSLNEQGSSVPPPEHSVARAPAPLGARATEITETEQEDR